MQTILSIYTPTFRRPRLLEKCIESVQLQTVAQQIQHYIWPDQIGVGIAGMFKQIPSQAQHLVGEYIYILQDDDVLADVWVIEKLFEFIQDNDHPDVVICRNVKREMILPTRKCWGRAPLEGHIDLGSYVVSRKVFNRHCTDFGARYAGDFDFIDAVYKLDWHFTWLDMILARAQALGLGRPESELKINES